MPVSSNAVTLDTLVALCKRRGFVFQSAEMYGGLNGVYDYGPLGTLMKHNIRSQWIKAMQTIPGTMLFMDGAILGSSAVWKASGHLDNFNDPLIDCLQCKHRYRADDINVEKPCPHCGQKAWTAVRQFNMMFKTNLGAASDQAADAYLRPETAQAIFINFKNVMTSSRAKIPFGIAQIGKAFRNEITPKQFLFRMREFEQMEMEWFCKAENSQADFNEWCERRRAFYASVGIRQEHIRLRPHAKDELAHYSTQCTDVEYQFPFGWKELEGIAHRGTFDLSQHSTHSGKDLAVFDEETKESFIPTVVECSVGVDRLFLTLLFEAYREDVVEDEKRVMLALHPTIAPIKAAFFPLSKQLTEQAHALYAAIKQKGISVQFDESGSIGKRYRRQDEIGTPWCFTYDFESPQDHCVTVRHRDTTQQERINTDHIASFLMDHLT